MAEKGKNLPVDYRWHDNSLLGAMAKPHQYINGEYIEIPNFESVEFPKMMYHPDYVHNRRPDIEYGFTQLPQLAETESEAKALREKGFKDSPREAGVVTLPDAEAQQKRRAEVAAAGRDWRAHLPNAAPGVSEVHLRFLQSQGVEVQTLADAYAFLAKFTSQQMNQFMLDAKEWERGQAKGKRA